MKLQRVLMILFYLLKRGTASTKELCEYLEVSKRTVYRDIDELKTAGVDIVSIPGAGGGHRLSKDFKLDRLLFSNYELESILTASNFLSQFNKTEFADAAKELVRKLNKLLPEQEDCENSQLGERVLVDCKYTFQGEDYFNRLRTIEIAVNNNILVYLKYGSPLCERMSTTGYVAPYGIINKVGYWYLAGYCYELECYRAFNISFIESLLLTGKNFERDVDFILQDFWKEQNTR